MDGESPGAQSRNQLRWQRVSSPSVCHRDRGISERRWIGPQSSPQGGPNGGEALAAGFGRTIATVSTEIVSPSVSPWRVSHMPVRAARARDQGGVSSAADPCLQCAAPKLSPGPDSCSRRPLSILEVSEPHQPTPDGWPPPRWMRRRYSTPHSHAGDARGGERDPPGAPRPAGRSRGVLPRQTPTARSVDQPHARV